AEFLQFLEREPGKLGLGPLRIGADHGLKIGQHQEPRAGRLELRLQELRVAALGPEPIEAYRRTHSRHQGAPCLREEMSTPLAAAQRIRFAHAERTACEALNAGGKPLQSPPPPPVPKLPRKLGRLLPPRGRLSRESPSPSAEDYEQKPIALAIDPM